MSKNFSFSIIKKSTEAPLARAGVIHTPHGDIETPAFIPVGTKATVKSLLPEDFVKYVGSEAVLANTYHLYLEPGEKIIKDHGGFAKMMNYKGPTFTDSGGFQVFSLGSAMGVGVSKIATREDLSNQNIDKNLEKKSSVKNNNLDTNISKFKKFILANKIFLIEIAICLFIGFLARTFGEDMNLLLNIVIMSSTFLIIDFLFFKKYRKNNIFKEIKTFLSNLNLASRKNFQESFNSSKEKSLVKISENGVEFRSVFDGSKHFFTAEKSMEIQHDLGADIFFAFDECTSPFANKDYQIEALERTHRWAKRSLEHHHKLGKSEATKEMQALYAVVQGGAYEDLRKESAKVLGEMYMEMKEESAAAKGSGLTRKYFDGFGIGGSFTKEDMTKILKITNENLPENKPRHFLGIGEIEDLFYGVENGIDTFDCVSPTRLARNGSLYTKDGRINIFNSKYKTDMSPVCDDPSCYAHNYTKSYLAHLFRSKEMIAATIASIHNLHFIVHLVKDIRQSIIEDRFFEFKKEVLENYKK